MESTEGKFGNKNGWKHKHVVETVSNSSTVHEVIHVRYRKF